MPTLTEEAKAFLERLNVSARKKLGQNFMVCESDIAYIADIVSLKEGEPVLEIGPGLGFLTRHLIQKRAKVLAVEKDRIYAEFLKEYFKNKAFEVLERDILQIDLKNDFQLVSPIQVVGNIPYNITSPILEWLIQQKQLIQKTVLTTQLEVAERLTAGPGTKSWGSLSVFLQVYADVSFMRKISRTSFYPSPHVDSAVVEIQFLEKPRLEIRDERKFFGLVRRAFQKRRKTLLNALTDENSTDLTKPLLTNILREASIDPTRRPETLTLQEWALLHALINAAPCV